MPLPAAPPVATSLVAAHADWSVSPNKRWLTVARRAAAGWLAEAPCPVGDPADAVRRLTADGAALALGLDLPLGLPRAFAAGRPERDFPDFLRRSSELPGFWRVAATLDEVSAQAPFYPLRGVRGMTRAAHAQRLGLTGPSALFRLCDMATAERPAGGPLFWTLGANQTGKGAIAAWRDWLGPALASGAPYALWPFEGGLDALLRPGGAAIAEVYPAECLRQLGLRLNGSKRHRPVRLAVVEGLRAVMARLRVRADGGLEAALQDGFGADAAGEDRFDSFIGLLGVVSVLDGHRPDFVPGDPAVRLWEGWVLGQTSLPAAVAPFSA